MVSRKEQELSRWDEGRALLRSGDVQQPLSRPDSGAELDSLSEHHLSDGFPSSQENGNGVFDFFKNSQPRSLAAGNSSVSSQGKDSMQSGQQSQAQLLARISTPFAQVSGQGHAYSGISNIHIPLPSIAEVDMTPRRSFLETRSNSAPDESPGSAAAALRASLGCTSPLKSRASVLHAFSDDTAMSGPPPSCPCPFLSAPIS